MHPQLGAYVRIVVVQRARVCYLRRDRVWSSTKPGRISSHAPDSPLSGQPGRCCKADGSMPPVASPL